MESAPEEEHPAGEPVKSVRVMRVAGVDASGSDHDDADDLVVVEEPLEIRVDGESLAVLMRTPGADRQLTAGFLLSEGVIEEAGDIMSLESCADPNRPHRQNVMQVRLAAGVDAVAVERARRRTAATASCGICGKASIDAALLDCPPLPHRLGLSRRFVTLAGPAALATQQVFSQTGGLHGAVLFALDTDDEAPRILARAEDVGRHNAVDKVVGQLLLQGRPAGRSALWLSGRAGFEVVQKALMASIPALIAVGAPTSLAIELATDAGMTLIGFARGGGRFNVYAGTLDG